MVRPRERHPRGLRRLLFSGIGLFLYVSSLIWNFHQITKTAQKLPIIRGIPGPNIQHRTPHTPASATSTARPLLPLQKTSSIRVLILVASIPRTPEMICATLQAVFDNFSSSPMMNNGSSRTNVAPVVEPPVLLIHRYGPWTCDDNMQQQQQGLPQHGSDCQGGISLILRLYPSHERVSNFQQIDDYLALMKDGLQLINGTEGRNKSNFSHVLFLDDDVELCPNFSGMISLIHTVTTTAASSSSSSSRLTLAHLGRGGSGILVPVSNLPNLLETVEADHMAAARKNKKQKNIDKSFLEWALQIQRGCTVRPTTIQMRHVGLQSRLHPGTQWEDVDLCGQAANNRAWQSLSENSLHPALFSENCVLSGECSPYSSKNGSKDDVPQIDSDGDDPGCYCLPGFTGRDCGIRTATAAATQHYYIRRKLNAPIVIMLSSTSMAEQGNEDLQHLVLADSRAHHLVNLYVLGNSPRTEWLAGNIYASTSDARHAFEVELRNSSRFGEMAFPKELVTLDRLLPPEELWTLKYYEAQHK